MIKKNSICGLISAFVMLCLPFLTVTFFNNENGLAIVMILLFIVNPITAVCIGAYAGRRMGTMWFWPLLLTALFVVGAWLFFALTSTNILIYAAVYLILSVAAMLLSSFIKSTTH